MNMYSPSVVTPPSSIYHTCSIRKKFWEEKFIPVNLEIYGRHNFRKHRDINNGEQYIVLDMYSKLDCMEKSKFTSS